MACGIPQVIAEWDGYKESVIHGETGFLVKTYWADCADDISCFPFLDRTGEWGNTSLYSHFLLSQATAIDLEEYEHSIQLIIDHVELEKRMKEKSITNAREKYAWDKIIKKYDELWEELLQVKKSTIYQKSRVLELFNNEYTKAFAHYPSHFIHESNQLILSREGERVLIENDKFQEHFRFEYLFTESRLSREILEMFMNERIKTVSSILEYFQREYIKDVILRSIMYLIKQGYVNILHD